MSSLSFELKHWTLGSFNLSEELKTSSFYYGLGELTIAGSCCLLMVQSNVTHSYIKVKDLKNRELYRRYVESQIIGEV